MPYRSCLLKQRCIQAASRPNIPRYLHTTSLCGVDNDSTKSSKASLHPEWEKMAKKVLKGSDPAEKLTWKTAEVG